MFLPGKVVWSYFALLALLSFTLCSCGGGSSKTTPVTPNPAPTFTAASPGSAAAGSAGFTLTVTGTNFITSSTVSFNGTGKPTTYVSSTQLTATISGPDLSAAGTATVTVTNPAPAGGSASGSFTIGPPAAPTVASLSPSGIVVGTGAFNLTVTGSNFVKTSIVQWKGSPRTTTYVSNTQLTAAINASDVSGTVGNYPVNVVTPSPGGGTSNSTNATVEYPLPAITSLNPSTAAMGGPPFTLTVNGSNFVSGATVYWNSISRVTTFVSSTELTADILASDLVNGGTANVTVQNPSPSAGVSNVEAFTLTNGIPNLTSLSPSTAVAGLPTQINIAGTNFASNATIQVGGKSVTVQYVSSTLIRVMTQSFPVGNLAVTVTNPPPGGGTSNVLYFNSPAAGPPTQLTPESLDTSGNPVQLYPNTERLSQNGRFLTFSSYLRDTCADVPAGCTPTTVSIPLNHPQSNIGVLSYPSDSGQYVGVGELDGDALIHAQTIELADTCLGASGCTPSNEVLVPSTQYVTVGPISADGRYVSYTNSGPSNSYTPVPYLWDTCTGASPGCTSQSIPLNTTGLLSFMDAEARYMLLTQPAAAAPLGVVVLHDSCIGAAPGCSPADTTLSDTSLYCSANFIAGDAQYAAYNCTSTVLTAVWNYQAFLYNSCIGVSGCTPSTTHVTALYEIDAVSSDGRFLLGETHNNVNNKIMASVYDTCTGATGSCTPKKQDLCFASDGSIANDDCYATGMTPDGKYLFINSPATNLGEPDGGGFLLANPLHP